MKRKVDSFCLVLSRKKWTKKKKKYLLNRKSDCVERVTISRIVPLHGYEEFVVHATLPIGFKMSSYKLENFALQLFHGKTQKGFCWLKSRPSRGFRQFSQKSTPQRTLMNRSIYYSSPHRCNYKTILLFQPPIDEGGTSVRWKQPIVPRRFLVIAI